MFETPQQPSAEGLKAELSKLTDERDELLKRIEESGENIDAELGSAEYKDFGYTIRLREITPRITEIEANLKDMDDAASAQRNLNI
jgi:archaellum component FlaC